MMKKYIYILTGILLLVATACEFNKMPLPVAKETNSGFGANDTSYVELQPIWNSEFLGTQLNYPTDIVTGPDGYVFLIDQGNDRIVAMNKSGLVLSHNNLGSLNNIENPTGIDIDPKLNLLVVNGGNTIYCWNQYFNSVGIDSATTRIVFRNLQTNEPVTIDLATVTETPDLTNYILESILYEPFSENNFPVRDLFVFYQDDTPGTKFNDVTSDGNFIYATDSGNQRIVKIGYMPTLILHTTDRFNIINYAGVFLENSVSYGTGAGTVDGPLGIQSDDDNIYFSQLGGNFKIQKLDKVQFSSQFVLYQDPIMDLNRFIEPRALALDNVGNIYVIDTNVGKVSKFTQSGNVKSLGKSGISVAEFNDARGLMVSENIIYVVESGENRVRRFQYSISDEDVPDENEP